MHKKLRTVAIIIPFLLFMTGEQQASPLPEINRGENEPRPAEKVSAPPTVKKPGPAHKPPAARAAGGRKRRREIPTRPRGLASKAKKWPRRKRERNSTSTIAAQRLFILQREYARRARGHLVITSFHRTPSQQARAVYNLIRRRNIAYVLNLYRHSPAIREIAQAYRALRRSPQQARKQMTVVIENQIARGVYVSQHLRGLAVDIRSRGRDGARLPILRDVARRVGARVSVEPDHFHVRLV